MSKTELIADKVESAISDIRHTLRGLPYNQKMEQQDDIIIKVAKEYNLSPEYLKK